jgi:integrase
MARRAKGPWYRASNETWYTTVGGVQTPLAAGRGNGEEAVRAFHELMAARGSAPRGAGRMGLAALLDLFLERAGRELAPLTYETYARHLGSFAAFAGATAAEDVRPHHVNRWAASAHPGRWGRGSPRVWSEATRHAAVAAVKAAFAWGAREGYIASDPVAAIRRPAPPPRGAVMTDAQAAAARGAADPDLRDFMDAMRETGARPSEVMRLEAGMIDPARGLAVMPGKTTRRTGRARTIHLTPAALALCLRLAALHPEGPIFRSRSGRPWTRQALSRRFGLLRRKLGFGREATAESFRHQFATDALAAGVPVASVAQLMGHRGTEVLTRTYSHLADRRDHLREALARVRPGPAGGEA